MRSLWIDGNAVPSESDKTIPVINPANKEIIDQIPVGCEADVIKAVESANNASSEWASKGPTGRRDYLLQVASKIETNAENIASILTKENGEPLYQSHIEIAAATNLLRKYAEMIVDYRVGSQGASNGEITFQKWEPRGVTGCIVPWNKPLLVAMETIAPNLAAGNTVVIKPSEKTPLSLRLLIECGFNHLPTGVCNVLLGDGQHCGETLVSHPKIDVVMFIGSVQTGRRIGEICGNQVKKAILELGGKDALIIDEDVDIEKASSLVKDCCFANSGQICTSTERVYVHKNIFDKFVSTLKKISEESKVGNGIEEDVDYGPLIDEMQLEKVESHVANARQSGAELITGGKKPDDSGYFYSPTVMVLDSKSQSDLLCDETFGPVAPLVPIHSFDEAIQKANDTEYGLGAIVITNNADHALQAMQGLNAGMIKINAQRGKAAGATSEPFGYSGIGHGYGKEVLQELTRQKSIQWKKLNY